MLNVAIIGASGYTGFELLRLLALHPDAKVTEVTSRQYKGKAVTEVFPSLSGFYDGLKFSDPEDLNGIQADIAFSALPHGASQTAVPALLKTSRVIDLSADFRIRDLSVYKAWYGVHTSPSLLDEAVYGLPELRRKEIKGARLVANPGCYPTSAILALAPLLEEKLADVSSIIIDSKSGVSGAGRQAAIETSFVEVSPGFKAYKIGSHRHTPEIEQELGAIAGAELSVTFTPHLLPVSRGILSTVYASLAKGVSMEEVLSLYRAFYEKEPFVRVMDEGRFPDISQVRTSNYCDLGVFVDEKKRKAIIVSAIDNLVKGASGQAIQNMNIMAGVPETTGLIAPPVSI